MKDGWAQIRLLTITLNRQGIPARMVAGGLAWKLKGGVARVQCERQGAPLRLLALWGSWVAPDGQVHRQSAPMYHYRGCLDWLEQVAPQ